MISNRFFIAIQTDPEAIEAEPCQESLFLKPEGR
jgi:hypothetical protein